MPFVLRPYQESDSPRVAAILNRIDPEPITAESLHEMYADFPAEGVNQWLVAGDEAGQVVAWGHTSRAPWYKAGKFRQFVAVDPDSRNRGAGTALADALEAFAREHGATEIETDVRETEDYSIRFADRRGFRRTRHLFESTLDVAAFADSRFAGVIPAVEATGIRFASYEQLGGGEALDRQIYAVYAEAVVDIPGHDGQPRPFEQWRKEKLQTSRFRADCYYLALEGDRVVGLTSVEWLPESQSMYNQLTGVLREYRGRQLALALKLHTLAVARRFGAVRIRTNNDSENAPMLAVNRKMGFAPEPGVYLMEKPL